LKKKYKNPIWHLFDYYCYNIVGNEQEMKTLIENEFDNNEIMIKTNNLWFMTVEFVFTM